MRHLKIFSLAAMATLVLMASSESASASVATSPAGTEYTGTLSMTSAFPNSFVFKAGISATCTGSTLEGFIDTNNENWAEGFVGTFSFSGCSKTVTVLRKGVFEISFSGTLRLAASEITIADSSLGISCVYGAGTSTSIGTISGGTTASVSISAFLTKISGSLFCASTAEWTGSYTVTTPDTFLLN